MSDKVPIQISVLPTSITEDSKINPAVHVDKSNLLGRIAKLNKLIIAQYPQEGSAK